MADGEGGTRTAGTALRVPHVRLTLEMALLLLGAELTRTLDLPWRVAGVVFSVLAVVQGVRALRAVRAHRRAHPDVQALGPAGGVLLVLGVVVGVGLTVVQVAMLALWPLVAEQEDCRDRALTRVALERCDDALVDRLEELGGIGATGPDAPSLGSAPRDA